ncbi:MAG: hypothetical protein JW762_01800 [Dehalococcoidales bacterium]|nr:hypothetical protein [Dehalococcoidales bacterium]
MNEVKEKSITLYDAGGFFLILLFFGVPLGTLFDFIWNLVVISVTLPRLPGSGEIRIHFWWHRLLFCLIITALGFVIDWAYFELTWDMSLSKSTEWLPAVPQWLQFIWLLLPMSMLFLVNAALSYSYFRLNQRQALIFGAVMAFFTTPWILPVVPYIAGWVINP